MIRGSYFAPDWRELLIDSAVTQGSSRLWTRFMFPHRNPFGEFWREIIRRDDVVQDLCAKGTCFYKPQPASWSNPIFTVPLRFPHGFMLKTAFLPVTFFFHTLTCDLTVLQSSVSTYKHNIHVADASTLFSLTSGHETERCSCVFIHRFNDCIQLQNVAVHSPPQQR